MKTLVLVDMQNDFITGKLGSKEAQAILPKVIDFVKSFNGDIRYTKDTHSKHEKPSIEIQHFGEHCMDDTVGQLIPQELEVELAKKGAEEYLKNSFMPNDDYADVSLWEDILDAEKYEGVHYQNNDVYVIGLCTDLCVLNTALYLRNNLQYDNIIVIEDLCAGTTPENHQKALDIMKINLIDIKTTEDVK